MFTKEEIKIWGLWDHADFVKNLRGSQTWKKSPSKWFQVVTSGPLFLSCQPLIMGNHELPEDWGGQRAHLSFPLTLSSAVCRIPRMLKCTKQRRLSEWTEENFWPFQFERDQTSVFGNPSPVKSQDTGENGMGFALHYIPRWENALHITGPMQPMHGE